MSDIEVGKYYICSRNGKSQIVKIDAIYKNYSEESLINLHLSINNSSEIPFIPNEIKDLIYKNIIKPDTYEYHYGFLGYHEGYCKKKHLRELTLKEKQLMQNNMFFALPHHFYDA
tara:strand:+ start:238 stop:582 length:345 start_codon:yes stop_codon:yes gene_type:complete